jgi:hypothetical protein
MAIPRDADSIRFSLHPKRSPDQQHQAEARETAAENMPQFVNQRAYGHGEQGCHEGRPRLVRFSLRL